MCRSPCTHDVMTAVGAGLPHHVGQPGHRKLLRRAERVLLPDGCGLEEERHAVLGEGGVGAGTGLRKAVAPLVLNQIRRCGSATAFGLPKNTKMRDPMRHAWMSFQRRARKMSRLPDLLQQLARRLLSDAPVPAGGGKAVKSVTPAPNRPRVAPNWLRVSAGRGRGHPTRACMRPRSRLDAVPPVKVEPQSHGLLFRNHGVATYPSPTPPSVAGAPSSWTRHSRSPRS